jgi:tyrosine-specific transport protein
MTTLGLVSEQGIQDAYRAGISGAELLARVTESSVISGLDQFFALFAIITSFFGVSMSLFDFLSDGVKQQGKKISAGLLFCICFAPPVYFALTNKRIFFLALEYAGAFGVVLLLALLPALMVWRKRYALHLHSSYVVPGGKVALIGFIALSFFLMACSLML